MYNTTTEAMKEVLREINEGNLNQLERAALLEALGQNLKKEATRIKTRSGETKNYHRFRKAARHAWNASRAI